MRQILLPCIRKYAEVGMWLNFLPIWGEEADRLSVRFGMPHGEALTDMVKNAQGDYLLFCEMDGIIFKPEIVHNYFLMLESGQYDVIGSPRMSCTPNIASIAQKKFGLDYTGLGDKGAGTWPCMLFIRRDLLMQTDLNFSNKGWKKGEQLFGETLEEDGAMDTFGWMSLQLRALGAKFLDIPQNHIHPDDLEKFNEGEGIFHSDVGYIHIGSISGDPYEPKTEMEQKELEKRVSWVELCGGKADAQFCDRERLEQWKDAYTHLLHL